jgi:Fuc2NAc and GlcNAc transferase
MMYSAAPFIIAAAFFIAFAGTLLVRRWATRLGLMDVPNARSSHVMPTPRGGGGAIVVAFVLSTSLLFVCGWMKGRMLIAVSAGTAVALAGFFDDLKRVSAPTRFAVHLGVGVVAAICIGGLSTPILASWGLHVSWLGMVLAVAIIVSAINVFNFMDGIDGLVASEAIFVATAGAILNTYAGGEFGITAAMLCLAAASAGFLVWNWPPASIFLGDVGSGFLGAIFAILALSVSNSARIPLEAWAILAGVFLVDATFTLIRRMTRGDHWLRAHRLHGYQHLARRLRSHRRVTLIVVATNCLWLLPWAWFAILAPESAKVALIASLAPLCVCAFLLGAGRPEQ